MEQRRTVLLADTSTEFRILLREAMEKTGEFLVEIAQTGNEVLEKVQEQEPDILIMDEPTRGIDVGAKHEIYEIMNDLAAQGKAIIMISSEMPELLGMCDRIYVMSEGRLAGEFTAEEATQERIMASIMQEQNKK